MKKIQLILILFFISISAFSQTVNFPGTMQRTVDGAGFKFKFVGGLGTFAITDSIRAASSGGGSAGVISFNGRNGIVSPQSSDYDPFYPLLVGTYNNPTWINTLAYSKITGVPAFITTETDPTVPAYAKTLTAFSVIKPSTDALYEPIFSKNTGFNKNFGTTAGTVAEGNDSRIVNALSTSTAASTYQTLANLSTDLTASASKYPSVNAVNTGLSLKQDAFVVNSISALSAYTGASTVVVVNDVLRGGTFVYSATGTVDNGITFSKSGGGYWVRLLEDNTMVNVCWFGAKGDGTTDDTQAIKDAIATTKAGGKIYFPNRNGYPSSPGSLLPNLGYVISEAIVISKPQIKVFSDGENNTYSTTIIAKTGTFNMFEVRAEQATFWGLTFRGNGTYTIVPEVNGNGRWGQNATINGILSYGDSGGDGELQVQHCSFLYVDTAVIVRSRNMTFSDNVVAVSKNGIAIETTAGRGEQRDFRIYDNWFHSIGDTTVNRFVIKSSSTETRQMWIHQNNIDGRTNALCFDISGKDALTMTGNTGTFTRAGFIRLNGVEGALVSNNTYVGDDFKTIGNGILLSNVTNSVISSNRIGKVAENSIYIATSNNNQIKDNFLVDYSWTGKFTPGTFSGLYLDAVSKNNIVSSNYFQVTDSTRTIGKYINWTDNGKNRLYLNTKVKSDLNDFYPTSFNSPVKMQNLVFGANSLDSIRHFDFSYVPANGSLGLSVSGKYTPLTLQNNGKIKLNTRNPDGSMGSADDVGDLLIRGTDNNLNRVPIGTAGQFLKVNSGANGLEYATISGGGGISGLTTNYIPKASSGTTIANSRIFDNGTNLGINTATPAYALDVNGGAVNGVGRFTSSGGAASFRLNNTTPTLGREYNFGSDDIGHFFIYNETNGKYVLDIDINGKWIIGETAQPVNIPSLNASALVKTNSGKDLVSAVANTDFLPPASPTMTGTPVAPTPGSNINTTQIPTTAWTNTYFAAKASPTFTGTPAGPTAATATNTTQLATTAFVKANIANYLPLTGGSLSGGLSGTTIAASGAISAGNNSNFRVATNSNLYIRDNSLLELAALNDAVSAYVPMRIAASSLAITQGDVAIANKLTVASAPTNPTDVVRLQDVSLSVTGTTAASTYSIPSTGGIYRFTGTTSTFTLPSVSSSIGKMLIIANRGSGTITLNTNAGANELYNAGTLSNTAVINITGTSKLINDGVNWSFY